MNDDVNDALPLKGRKNEGARRRRGKRSMTEEGDDYDDQHDDDEDTTNEFTHVIGSEGIKGRGMQGRW